MVRGMAVPPQKISLGRSRQRELADLVEVDAAGVLADAVVHRREPLAGGRHAPAVGEVAAHRQRHAHHGVARLQEGQVDRPGWPGEPEYGWTLAWSTPNSALARSMASVSTWSMTCWPS